MDALYLTTFGLLNKKTPAHAIIKLGRARKTLNITLIGFVWKKKVISPIRTVIVSQGDVSDFHHIQGVVGDLIAIRIQDVGVFLSPPPWKSPDELPTVFWQTPRSCGNLIAVRIHISEFTRRNRFKIQCLIPFLSTPEHRNVVLRCNLHIISEMLESI